MLQDQSRNRTPMPAAQQAAYVALPEPGPARAEVGIARMLSAPPHGDHPPADFIAACDWALRHTAWIDSFSGGGGWDDARISRECDKASAVWKRAVETQAQNAASLAAKSRMLLVDLEGHFADFPECTPDSRDLMTMSILRDAVAMGRSPSAAPVPSSDISSDLRAALDERAAAEAAGRAEPSDDDEVHAVHEAREDAADDKVLVTPCRTLADVGAKLNCLIPRIRPDLLNQRHAEHLEAICTDIEQMLVPETVGTDLIFAALTLYREASAAMDAFSARIRGRSPTADEFGEEGRLSAKQCETRDAVLARVPTTTAGRAALVDFVRAEIDASGMADGGPPDDDHPIWRDGLRALLAAQEAELRAGNGVVHPDAALLALVPTLLPLLDEYDRLWAASQEAYGRAAAALGGEPHYDVVGRDAADDWHRRFVASPGYAAYILTYRPADAFADRIEAMVSEHMEVPASTLAGLLLKTRIGRSLEHYLDVAADDLDRMVEAGEGPDGGVPDPIAVLAETNTATLAAPEGSSPALIAMIEEWQALLDRINGGGLTDTQVEALGSKHDDIQRAIYDFPAASIADLLAKVPVFKDELHDAVGSLNNCFAPKDTLSGAAWLGLFRDFEHLAGTSSPPVALSGARLEAADPHPATAAGADADAALIALVARFEAADRDREAADEMLGAAYDASAASAPSRPAALRRAGDFRHFWGAASSLESPVFYDGTEVRRLRDLTETGHLHPQDRDAALARAAEIATAWDEWRAAYEANDVACGVIEAEARYEELRVTCEAVRSEIMAHRPTTLAGFAAKARAWRFATEKKFAEAIRADLMAMGEAEGHRQVEPSIGYQIITCWREWAAQPDGDETEQGKANFERLSAERSALFAAAEALPVTLGNMPIKALALAWLEYVDLWENGRPRDAYAVDGRLALDIDTAITGRLKTSCSGEAA